MGEPVTVVTASCGESDDASKLLAAADGLSRRWSGVVSIPAFLRVGGCSAGAPTRSKTMGTNITSNKGGSWGQSTIPAALYGVPTKLITRNDLVPHLPPGAWRHLFLAPPSVQHEGFGQNVECRAVVITRKIHTWWVSVKGSSWMVEAASFAPVERGVTTRQKEFFTTALGYE